MGPRAGCGSRLNQSRPASTVTKTFPPRQNRTACEIPIKGYSFVWQNKYLVSHRIAIPWRRIAFFTYLSEFSGKIFPEHLILTWTLYLRKVEHSGRLAMHNHVGREHGILESNFHCCLHSIDGIHQLSSLHQSHFLKSDNIPCVRKSRNATSEDTIRHFCIMVEQHLHLQVRVGIAFIAWPLDPDLEVKVDSGFWDLMPTSVHLVISRTIPSNRTLPILVSAPFCWGLNNFVVSSIGIKNSVRCDCDLVSIRLFMKLATSSH